MSMHCGEHREGKASDWSVVEAIVHGPGKFHYT